MAPLPAQFVHIAKKRCVDSQCREPLEEECPFEVVFENLREGIVRAVRNGLSAWRLSWVRSPRFQDSRLRRHPPGQGSQGCAPASRRTWSKHPPRRESARSCDPSAPRAGQRHIARGPCPESRCIPSELARPGPQGEPRKRARHRPPVRPSAKRATPIAASASSRGSELCVQHRFDAVAGLVLWPQIVAKRLDNVIRRDPDVRRAALDHLSNCTQHAPHRAIRRIGSLGPADSIKVTKQLVGAIDQVNNHSRQRSVRK